MYFNVNILCFLPLNAIAHETAHVAENAVETGALDKMKSFGGDVLSGLGKGLFTNDKVFTPGAGGKGIDWTATLSKSAGRMAQA